MVSKDYLRLIPGGADLNSPSSAPSSDQPSDQGIDEARLKKLRAYTVEEIVVIQKDLRFTERLLATLDQKNDNELYEILKKFDGSCLDGHLEGDRYPNSPHPEVRKRKSDGRFVYHNPESRHHDQLLIVRLIEMVTDKRERYRKLLEDIDMARESEPR